jgi:hypothetical protein
MWKENTQTRERQDNQQTILKELRAFSAPTRTPHFRGRIRDILVYAVIFLATQPKLLGRL